jgi:hypothetical protein
MSEPKFAVGDRVISTSFGYLGIGTVAGVRLSLFDETVYEVEFAINGGGRIQIPESQLALIGETVKHVQSISERMMK